MSSLLGRRLGPRLGPRLIFAGRRSRRPRRLLEALILAACAAAVYGVLQVSEAFEIIEGLIQTLRSALAHSSHRFIGGPATVVDPA